MCTDMTRLSPNRQVVYEGNNAYFHCHSSLTPVWTHEGKKVQRNVKVYSGGRLEIRGVEESNSGLYECVGATSDNKAFMSKGRLIVQSKSKDIIINIVIVIFLI